MKCSLFPFFFVGYSLGGGGISGRVRALNLTVPLGSGRVGSDNLGYGPGSGFSFEPVQTSTVLSSEKRKKERKLDSGHVPGLLEEDNMGCQSSKENSR